MRLNSVASSSRDVKKGMYEIMVKFHNFEYTSRVKKMTNRVQYAVYALEHMNRFLQYVPETSLFMGNSTRNKILLLKNSIIHTAKTKRRITQGLVADILKGITRAYNRSSKVKISINQKAHDEWTSFVRAAYAAWGR